MDAIEFLRLAEQLNTAFEKNEAVIRSTISRAYYATYHAAKWLDERIQNYTAPGRMGIHAQLYRKLKEFPPTQNHDGIAPDAGMKIRKLGILLSQLHAYRLTADYALGTECSAALATTALTQARKILDQIDDVKKLINE